MYYSYHKIIKCVDFKSIYYIINLDAVSFFRVFNEFDSLFLSDILLILINEIIIFSKKTDHVCLTR